MGVSFYQLQHDSRYRYGDTILAFEAIDKLAKRLPVSHHLQDQGDHRRRSKKPLPPSELWNSMLTLRLQWMVMVIDDGSKKIIDNSIKEDDILNNNIASSYRLPRSLVHSLNPKLTSTLNRY